MKLRAPLLGGAALAATLLLAPPVFAGYYQTNPTPQDRAATERTSEESLARTRAAVAADRAARQRYDAEHAAFERASARAALALERARQDGELGARRWDAFYGRQRFEDIATVPSGRLLGMTVNTRGGAMVGRICDVDAAIDGRAVRIAVGVGPDDVVWVDSDDLRYDPQTRAVLTDLSRDQLSARAQMRFPRF